MESAAQSWQAAALGSGHRRGARLVDGLFDLFLQLCGTEWFAHQPAK